MFVIKKTNLDNLADSYLIQLTKKNACVVVAVSSVTLKNNEKGCYTQGKR